MPLLEFGPELMLHEVMHIKYTALPAYGSREHCLELKFGFLV